MKRVTVSDVAERAGVSQGTVSRVLTGKNWVSEDARLRVQEAARELGYVPNAMAQGLKAQRTRTIAALVSDMSNPLHAEFLAAAEAALRASGYLLVVASTHSKPEQERELISLFSAGRADGLIVAHNESSVETYEALRQTRLPIVFHDREAAHLGDAVVADHRSGAREATEHLIQLGHRRIAILTPPATVRPSRERLVGYRNALQDADVQFDESLVRSLDASSDMAYSEVKTLLEGKRRPTAIITLGTHMLAGVLMAVSSKGMEIPHDISVVGVGDTDLLRLHTPSITSVRWDLGHCGRLAAGLMLERLQHVDAIALAPRQRHVPVELVLRRSTGVPPRRRA